MKITGTIIRVVGLHTVVHMFKSHYLGGRGRENSWGEKSRVERGKTVRRRAERGDKRRGRTKIAQGSPQPGVEG